MRGGRSESRQPRRQEQRPDRSSYADAPIKESRKDIDTQPVTPERLGEMMAHHGFHLTPPQLELLTRFHQMLIERNRVLNITRIWNLEDIVLKHYVDCLIVLRYIPDLPSPLLDIGTGGGFPGIPLKIVRPDVHIILGEGVRKRVDFLRDVREELALERLDLIGRNIDTDFEYPVQGVITRAVESIRDTLGRVRMCTMPGAHIYFMKGPNVDDEKEMALKKYGHLYDEVKDISYRLPNSSYQRRLVVYRKKERQEEDE